MDATPNVTDLIFSGDPPTLGDPAEDYIEASKLGRRMSHVQVPGVYMLESNPWMVQATSRAGMALDHCPVLPLELPDKSGGHDKSLAAVLSRRRSPDRFASAPPLSTDRLAAWCWATAGANGSISPVHTGRTYPSAGAMFPCDLFVSLPDGGDVGPPGGTYHYEPRGHRLLKVNDHGPTQYAAVTAQPESFVDAGAVWIVVAAIWRSRFKYGQRSLRFALLEAGHIVQNLLLAAAADGQAGRAIGGFFDDELADLLSVDGVHEFPVYMAVTGVAAPELLPLVRTESGARDE